MTKGSKKPDLSAIATVAEIVASVAVIISLVFVVLSLNQNTAAIRSVNDNFLYELQDSWLSAAHTDPALRKIVLKVYDGHELSREEQFTLDFFILRELNILEVAFTRHKNGLMPPDQWTTWSEGLKRGVLVLLPEERWQGVKDGYSKEFREHVDAYYSEN